MYTKLLDFIDDCAAVEADPDEVLRRLEAEPDLSTLYQDYMSQATYNSIPTAGGVVYRLPIMNPDGALALAQMAAELPFKQNLSEAHGYRIDECVLNEVAPNLYAHLVADMSRLLNAISLLIFSRPIKHYVSVQMARYTPDSTAGTGWHHDTESDFSVVISLNPGDFTGGGTGVRLGPEMWAPIEPLPAGYAMVFNGKSVQHRGLEVTAGQRLLLVFWCSWDEPK